MVDSLPGELPKSGNLWFKQWREESALGGEGLDSSRYGAVKTLEADIACRGAPLREHAAWDYLATRTPCESCWATIDQGS